MRTKHFGSVALLLVSLVFIGAGCSRQLAVSTPAAPVANNQAVPTPKPNAATSDACGNPYYPFKPGLAITYGTTPAASTDKNSDYTIRIVSVSGTTATIRAEMAGGVTAEMQADCASGTVAMKGTFDLGAAQQGLKFKTTVVSSNGSFMPANVAVGSVWNNSQTVKMESEGGSGVAAGMGPITATTTEQSKAVGEESVTVPAGTYDALKVEVARTTTSQISGLPAGVKLPPGVKLPEPAPVTTTSTEWWVKGIGMVKTVTTTKGEMSTVEAKSVAGR